MADGEIKQSDGADQGNAQPDQSAEPGPSAAKRESGLPAPASGGGQRVLKKLNAVVEKTVLDLDACRDVMSRLITDNKSIDPRGFRAGPDDIKPIKPLEQYKLAAPCDSDWDSLVGTNRCRFCSACGLNVYDCSKLDQSEIEQTVLQKENKEDFVLYKRKDGKFLTANCPVGQKRVRSGIITIASVVVIVAGLISVSILIASTKRSTPQAESMNQILHMTAPAVRRKNKQMTAASPNSDVAAMSAQQVAPGYREPQGAAEFRNSIYKMKLPEIPVPADPSYYEQTVAPTAQLSGAANGPVPAPSSVEAPAANISHQPAANLSAPSESTPEVKAQQAPPIDTSGGSTSPNVQYYGARPAGK